MSIVEETHVIRERREVLYILFGCVFIVFVMVFVFLLPLRSEREKVIKEAVRVNRELRAFRRVPREKSVYAQLEKAKRRNREFRMEWEELRARVDTFKGRSPLGDTLSAYKEGRIDFKVALFNARESLMEKSADKKVVLPSDLGMDETIGTDEDAETRLWQLASVVELIEQAIELGIPVVEKIESIRPALHVLLEEENAVALEFPVRVTMRCPFDRMAGFLDALLKEGTFFALRRFRAERIEKDESKPLRIVAVCGAELFQLGKDMDAVIPDLEPLPVSAGRKGAVAPGEKDS